DSDRVPARHQDRRVPLEAVLEVAGGAPGGELGPGRDLALLAETMIVVADRATVAAAVELVGVAWIGGDPAALAAGDGVPVLVADAAAARRARHRDAAVVLLRAVDPVGEAVVGGDAVELRGGLVANRRPGAAAVVAHRAAAVGAEDHALRVVGIQPQVVVVPDRLDRAEGL